MTIKRADIEEEQDDEIGWSWENCVNGVDKIKISGNRWVDLYDEKDNLRHSFAREELKHVIKALQNAEKWFKENT